MRTFHPFLIAIALCAVGCGKKNPGPPAECSVNGDCVSGKECVDGECVGDAVECTLNADCDDGFVCLLNVCEPIDDNNGVEDMGTPPPVDMGGNNGVEDMNFDNIAPTVTGVTPLDGAVDVPLDTAATVTFSEPMRATTINIQSIEIRDPANMAVAAAVTYDEATQTATLQPSAPLNAGSPYRIVATQYVRDLAGNALESEFEAKFYTVYEEPAGLRTVAETWAPVIYQALGSIDGGGPNLDIPTNVDFDNNLTARDNKSKAVLASTRTTATVYYNVVESKTHYFITYAMYYPAREVQQTRYEHDFTGAVFVVDKATDKLLLVEGVKVEEGVDASIGFAPDDSTVSDIAAPRFNTFPAADMEEGTHYPLFVPAGEHEACNFPLDGTPPFCLHNGGEFPGGPDMGVVLRWGMQGQRYMDATVNMTSGFKELTYALVPLASTLWRWRTNVGSEELWQQTAVYTPVGQDRPATTVDGSPIVLPNRLFSDDMPSFGKPPFQWLRTSTESNNGQWLIDPAEILLARYDFGATWSKDYCYNVFLNLNLRGDPNNPECGVDP